MTEKEKNTNDEIEDSVELNEEQTAENEAAQNAEKETDKKEDKADIEKELNDKYIRLMAEFDNFKKRTQKEKIQIYTTAAADVIEAVLPFLDNLRRAISVPAECEETKNLIDGIKLIERQFDDILTGLGVEPIEAVGKEFDPQLHDAVMHIDDETVDGENIVVEEFVKGYKYKDKVVRHSTVKVAN